MSIQATSTEDDGQVRSPAQLAVLQQYADAATTQIANMADILLECRTVIGGLQGDKASRHGHLIAKIDAVLPPGLSNGERTHEDPDTGDYLNQT